MHRVSRSRDHDSSVNTTLGTLVGAWRSEALYALVVALNAVCSVVAFAARSVCKGLG